MTLELIRATLAWSTLLNFVVLLSWFLLFVLARDWMYRLHSRWFRLSEETFAALHYGGMGLFKLGILLFNLMPYLALRIIG
jgi:hypothetical protein